MGKTIINSISVIAMTLCITAVSIELNNTIVLGWYIVPGIMHIFSIVSDDIEEMKKTEVEWYD